MKPQRSQLWPSAQSRTQTNEVVTCEPRKVNAESRRRVCRRRSLSCSYLNEGGWRRSHDTFVGRCRVPHHHLRDSIERRNSKIMAVGHAYTTIGGRARGFHTIGFGPPCIVKKVGHPPMKIAIGLGILGSFALLMGAGANWILGRIIPATNEQNMRVRDSCRHVAVRLGWVALGLFCLTILVTTLSVAL